MECWLAWDKTFKSAYLADPDYSIEKLKIRAVAVIRT